MSISPVGFPDLSAAAGASGISGISGIGSLPTYDQVAGGAAPITATTPTTPTDAITGTDAVNGASDTGGTDFGSLVADGLDRLQGLQNTSSNLAVQAATGDLSAIHDYTIAATEASTATQLTVALRNQAIGAFNQIMQMQI
jgi:flagellar hook-basal body complex protein FliE